MREPLADDKPGLAPAPASNEVLPSDRSAFLRLMGAAQVPAPPGKVRIRLPELRDELLNQLPAVQAGVSMALLDAVMSRAAGARASAPSPVTVTVEMVSRFHRPARSALLAEGWVVHASRNLCSCAAQLLDEQGRLVATASGTFKYWKEIEGAEKKEAVLARAVGVSDKKQLKLI